MDSSVLSKDEIWFLRVCNHISTWLYATDSCYLKTDHRTQPVKPLWSRPDQYNVAVCIWVTWSSYLKPSVHGASRKSVACILSSLTSLQSCWEHSYIYTEGFMALGRRERRYYCYNGTTERLLCLVPVTKLDALHSLPPLHFPSYCFRPK